MRPRYLLIYLHLHATLSDANYHTFGGHLNAAIVSGTCELIIDVIDGACDREFSDSVGLNLLNVWSNGDISLTLLDPYFIY